MFVVYDSWFCHPDGEIFRTINHLGRFLFFQKPWYRTLIVMSGKVTSTTCTDAKEDDHDRVNNKYL